MRVALAATCRSLSTMNPQIQSEDIPAFARGFGKYFASAQNPHQIRLRYLLLAWPNLRFGLPTADRVSCFIYMLMSS